MGGDLKFSVLGTTLDGGGETWEKFLLKPKLPKLVPFSVSKYEIKLPDMVFKPKCCQN